MAVTDWSTTAASNTSVGGVSIAEGWAPASVNNAIRALMAEVAQGIDDGDFATTSGLQPLDATLTALAGLATGADKLPYSTGTDTFAQTDFTSYGRTLVGLADAAALRTNIGAVTSSAASLAKPGFFKINIGGTDVILQWGQGSIGGNTTGTITFPTSFASFGVCIVSGGPSSTSREGDVHVTSATGLSSQAILNSADASAFYNWFAIGV